MPQPLPAILFLLYWVVALCVFTAYLVAFLKDTQTPKTDRLSWMVLCIGAVLWIIVLPISAYLALIRRSKNTSGELMSSPLKHQ